MANPGSVGSIIAQLVLDTSEATEALQRFSRLAEVSQEKLDGFVKAGKLWIPVGSEVAHGLDSQTEGLGKTGKAADGAEKSYRQWFQQQRFQNRIAREVVGSLSGLAFALSFVAGQSGESNKEFKQFSHALLIGVTGMNAAEFSAFSLGRSMSKLPGTLGQVGVGLARASTAIGIIVGVGAALFTFFSKTSEEAKKAAEEGVQKFITALLALAAPAQIKTLEETKNRLAAIRAEMELLGEVSEVRLLAEFGPLPTEPLNTAQKERLEALKKEKEQLTDIEKAYERMSEATKIGLEWAQKEVDVTFEHGTDLQRINAQLKQLTQEKETGLAFDKESAKFVELTDIQIRNRATQIVQLTNEKKKLTEDIVTKTAEETAGAAKNYEFGSITANQYIVQLKAIKELLPEISQQLG